MPTEIGNRIRNYLFLNKEINLPGIGNFKVYHIDQYLSNNETIIHPPFVKIRFKESVPKERFNSKLSKYYFDEEVESKLETHFQAVINDVLNFGEAEIDGLGVLRRMKKGEIVFIPSELLDVENKYLPIIDTLSFKSKSEERLNKKSISESFASEKGISESISKPHVILKETDTLKKPVSKIESKTVYQSKVSKPNYVLWAGLSMGFLLLVTFIVTQCYFSDDARSEAIIDEALMSLVTSKNEISDNHNKIVTEITKSVDSPSFGDDNQSLISCVVIVGSFKNKINAENLMLFLQKRGENSVLISRKMFTRVGIEFQSEKSKLQVNLNKIRDNYNKEAWYLEPPYTEF